MAVDSPGSGSRQAHLEALSTLDQKRETLHSQIQSLDVRGKELTGEEEQISRTAADLEERIRKLAEEEARLLERKKKLQDEARLIGDRRSQVASKRKQLNKERDDLLSEDKKIEARRTEAQQHLAYEEALQQASIQRQPEPKQSEASGDETRTHPRMSVKVEVSMHTEHNFYTGLTENLSEGGLFIATFEELPMGTNMELLVNLPDHPPIKAQGVVRWIREHTQFTEDVSPGVGVEFSDLSAEDREAIERFIKTREPLFYEAF